MNEMPFSVVLTCSKCNAQIQSTTERSVAIKAQQEGWRLDIGIFARVDWCESCAAANDCERAQQNADEMRDDYGQ